MIKLIKSDDLKLVGVGSILYKDLRENPNVSTLKLYENDSFIRYQVHQIAAGFYQLAVPDDEVPDGPFEINGMVVTGIGDNSPVLNKTEIELYTEGIWWLQADKN